MSGSTRWSQAMVARLVELKADGHCTFYRAWELALKENPPRGSDMGEFMPTLWQHEDDSLVEFLRTACDHAWHGYVGGEPGQGKALARFGPEMLAALQDSSGPAGRSPHRMAAA
jgi:hypothetical protein